MLRFRLLLILIINFTAISLVASDSESFLIYKSIDIKDGLSQNRINSIYKSKDGYLWIATDFGLNRYDGTMIKKYFHNDYEPYSLSSNKISFVVEDSYDNLWVGTSRGLCLYNKNRDSFYEVEGTSSKVVYSYLLLADGIFFGINNSLYFYDYDSEKLSCVYKGIFARQIVYYEECIYINTRWHGIYKFDRKNGILVCMQQFKSNNYTSMYVDSLDRLWLASYEGLACYKDNRIIKYLCYGNSELSNGIVLDIVEKDKNLLLATDGGGIYSISLSNFYVRNVSAMNGVTYSLPEKSFCHIYCDSNGNVFAGSVRRGVYFFKKVNAYTYDRFLGEKNSNMSAAVLCFCRLDEKRYVMIGTDGMGINVFDLYEKSFRHVNSTKDDRITSIIEYSDNELLYYAFGKGFYLINRRTEETRSFDAVDDVLNDSIYRPEKRATMFRCDDKIYISSFGFFVYDIIEKKLEKIVDIEDGLNVNNPVIVGKYGEYIYVTDGSDICRYNVKTGTFNKIYSCIHTINDAVIDENGMLYVGTENGVFVYNIKDNSLERISENILDEVTSVMYDGKRRLFIGTRRELFIYLIDEERMILMDEYDGISPNEYKCKSYLNLPNGDILFGGICGMAYIKSGYSPKSVEHSRISLMDLQVNGVRIGCKECKGMKCFDIPWDYKSLDFTLKSGIDNIFQENHFRVRIGDSDSKFLYFNSNSFRINYLPEGLYDVFVSSYNKVGKWNEEVQICKLNIYPPWWRSKKFFLLLFFSTFLFVILIVYWLYHRNALEHRRQIDRLKNSMYEEKIDFLINLSHELRTPLTLIYSPLKRILRHEVPANDIERNLLMAYQQVDRIKTIINMVLDIRKLEEGKSMLYILPHKLNKWVEQVVERFNIEFEAKNISCKLSFDESVEEVLFDDGKCDFVLSNFLSNSLKFSEEDTVITVSTSLLDDKHWVRVSVKDQGIGLNSVDLDSVFTRFYQGNHDKGGSGIGLAYAKKIIDWHKGKIGAFNNGEGAVFYFDLPISIIREKKDVTDNKIMSDTDGEKDFVIDSSFEDYSILVAEDDIDLRNYLKETFMNSFSKVYVASNGMDALKKIKEKLPDIIVSDVMMPKMNGFDLCKEVKKI